MDRGRGGVQMASVDANPEATNLISQMYYVGITAPIILQMH